MFVDDHNRKVFLAVGLRGALEEAVLYYFSFAAPQGDGRAAEQPTHVLAIRTHSSKK